MSRVRDPYTHRGRRVVTEHGVTYVPVDPKTELPEYIVKILVHGTRTRRAIARLRSYAIRGRVTAEVRLLDDGALAALARVKLYHSLFGLPHVLFKEIVSKL